MSENKIATKADLQRMYNKMLPYLGGMPEMVVNKFSKGDLYSTEERMIGQWIDGKPVYQKTVKNTTLSTISNNSWDNYIEIINIENLVFWQFGRLNGNGNLVDVMGDISCWYDPGTKYLKVRSRTDSLSCANGSISTLQYTKTTDSAISIGTDTDYSTEEKIVGTWIDGKPLYQKTYEVVLGTLANDMVDVAVTFETDLSKQIKNYSGIVYASNFTRPIPQAWGSADDKGPQYKIFVFQDSTGFQVIHNRLTMGGLTSHITIQYTKTTD